MKIVSINCCNYGSTGNIMLSIAELSRKEGDKHFVCFPNNRSCNRRIIEDSILIGNSIDRNIHFQLARFTGKQDCYSTVVTKKLIKSIDEIEPQIIHLHNIHTCYLNIELLFNYIKSHNLKIIWTLHDCWAFTGRCPYFFITGCEKWKKGCTNCPYPSSEYPQTNRDETTYLWSLKKKIFTSLENIIIVTPSQWLADLVKQSFLKDYPIRVINNGIDLEVFKPTESDFRARYALEDKYVLLGVAFGWGKRKGLDVFVELASRLSHDYQIVLVGTNDKIDQTLPKNIISIHRTSDQHELAEIYSAADLFVNPTREENYPTVNMEAIACGTPVLTFRTGGSPEIPDEKTGYVVDVDDIDELEKQIIRICTEKCFSLQDCLERAKTFDRNTKFLEYISLYGLQRHNEEEV